MKNKKIDIDDIIREVLYEMFEKKSIFEKRKRVINSLLKNNKKDVE